MSTHRKSIVCQYVADVSTSSSERRAGLASWWTATPRKTNPISRCRKWMAVRKY